MTPKCPDCKRDQDECVCLAPDEMQQTIERQAAQIEQMHQQLSAALAACKLKDDADLRFIKRVLEGSNPAEADKTECLRLIHNIRTRVRRTKK